VSDLNKAYTALDAAHLLDHDLYDEAWAALDAVSARVVALEAVLEKIAAQQPKVLEVLRSHGIVFRELGHDPTNFEHVAFSIYTYLCEVDCWAREALAVANPEDPCEKCGLPESEHVYGDWRDHPGNYGE